MTTTTRVYTGANHAELCGVLQRWATAVEHTHPALLNPAQLGDAAQMFADMLDEFDPTNFDDRDSFGAEVYAAEAGLCPDSQDHLMVECHLHGCDNYLEHLSDLAPWGTPAGQLGEWA